MTENITTPRDILTSGDRVCPASGKKCTSLCPTPKIETSGFSIQSGWDGGMIQKCQEGIYVVLEGVPGGDGSKTKALYIPVEVYSSLSVSPIVNVLKRKSRVVGWGNHEEDVKKDYKDPLGRHVFFKDVNLEEMQRCFQGPVMTKVTPMSLELAQLPPESVLELKSEEKEAEKEINFRTGYTLDLRQLRMNRQVQGVNGATTEPGGGAVDISAGMSTPYAPDVNYEDQYNVLEACEEIFNILASEEGLKWRKISINLPRLFDLLELEKKLEKKLKEKLKEKRVEEVKKTYLDSYKIDGDDVRNRISVMVAVLLLDKIRVIRNEGESEINEGKVEIPRLKAIAKKIYDDTSSLVCLQELKEFSENIIASYIKYNNKKRTKEVEEVEKIVSNMSDLYTDYSAFVGIATAYVTDKIIKLHLNPYIFDFFRGQTIRKVEDSQVDSEGKDFPEIYPDLYICAWDRPFDVNDYDFTWYHLSGKILESDKNSFPEVALRKPKSASEEGRPKGLENKLGLEMLQSYFIDAGVQAGAIPAPDRPYLGVLGTTYVANLTSFVSSSTDEIKKA